MTPTDQILKGQLLSSGAIEDMPDFNFLDIPIF